MQAVHYTGPQNMPRIYSTAVTPFELFSFQPNSFHAGI